MNFIKNHIVRLLANPVSAFVLFGLFSVALTSLLLLNSRQKDWQEEKRNFDSIIRLYESYNTSGEIAESDHFYKVGNSMFSRVRIMAFNTRDVGHECINRLSELNLSLNDMAIIRVCQNLLPSAGNPPEKEQLTTVMPILSPTDKLIGLRIRVTTLGSSPGFGNIATTSAEVITLACISLMVAVMGSLLSLVAKKYLIELPTTARYDDLTGFLRRDAFYQSANRALKAARHENKPLCAMLIDIDHFKQVNDTLGHAAGDEALKAVADVIRHSFRRHDILCRLGGDEFAVILPNISQENAVRVAERVREGIHELGHASTSMSPGITVSIGLVTVESPDEGLDEIIRRADVNLYLAKRTRNCTITTPLARPLQGDAETKTASAS
ncbi:MULTISPECIES: GGDEF domain-containing protein [Dickeya]|uniref:diguanylate cyclase n=1 Tax=Dickeya fangzhongdai TaxID=1778540 RepID=A0A2K8QR39_9GAMM|nr:MULTISPECIES: GGDEF domain-containing protein [Dickeya]ATZ95916.1 GGDEF domain-containing protein [Dickeya fangzhongdai]AYH49566.1 GGDEF domain-containing protein [Dickeya fangzhongdai]MBO8134467.1 GGDEF domain-containing protein [Dickeya fangzhongdai]QOH49359.1 GGDEF domain-containing protein [Dickeya fangzhongdai]QOH53663.1 GGDEF domain-containing protein [Dickeya fangzhongdai]